MCTLVFITAPGLIQHLHPSQVAPRQAHWPAITLAIERPWYLLVHRVACGGRTRSQTTLVAWDTTLMALLACIPVADLMGMARLERRTDEGAGSAPSIGAASGARSKSLAVGRAQIKAKGRPVQHDGGFDFDLGGDADDLDARFKRRDAA